MESFEEILSVGGHTNSLGRANEVLQIVKSDPTKLDELFKCIYSLDAWVRMRAIDSFEKLVRDEPRLAQPYVNELINDLTKSNQASIQWHLAQLFIEIKLTKPQSDKAVAWLKSKVSSLNVDWIVSVNVMKAMQHFYEQHQIHVDELMALFEIQTNHKSKSVRKKAMFLLDNLK